MSQTSSECSDDFEDDFWPNIHIYIPMMAVVFGIPILVILGICLIQIRNRRIQQQQSEMLHNRRLSTQSGSLYVGNRSRS
ncbi:unnamed protein product, partial [Mesorhabditis belari]|uniref:Uncharacterized protein n=1 Tax=Mesorhabditis belari TaxID=2138241 RepID=A0AAF3FLF9_9BILA